MSKVQMGNQALVYPRRVFVVGANVDGKPNFMTIAMDGIANGAPPMVSIALRHNRHTMRGIRQNMTFSLNAPSVDQAKETDYCGLVSGAEVDKAAICRFKVFYGKLGNAPLIEQFPINIECRVLHILGLTSHSLVIGQVEETHVSDTCLTSGKLDIDKIGVLYFTGAQGDQYRALGPLVAKAHSVGRDLEAR